MNLGLYLSGTKEEILLLIDKKAENEKQRFNKVCQDNQVFEGWEDPELRTKPLHRKAPIKNDTSAVLIDAAVAHCKEMLSDLQDNEECSFAFQITIQRRNYR